MRGRGLAVLAVLAMTFTGCGGPRKGPATAASGQVDLDIEDVIVPGEAFLARTSIETVLGSALTSVLVDGLERQATARVPALGRALEASGRAPLVEADEIVITARSLDENSGLLAVTASYSEDVDWFEDVVLAFHGGTEEEGALAELPGGALLGVIARDTRIAWNTDLTAAVCAVRFTPRLVSFVAAPDPGECRVWASWIIARQEGDGDLIEKLEDAPGIGGEPPPLAMYVDGKRFAGLCCAPFGLERFFTEVEEAWVGLDPGAPASLELVASFESDKAARMQRDAIAQMLDAYAPVVRMIVPGLAKALDRMTLVAEGTTLELGFEVDAETTLGIADLLSTML